MTDEGLYQGTAEGVITRTPSGTATLEVRMAATTFDYVEAKNAEEAVRFVFNVTRNYANASTGPIRIVWGKGLPELWAMLL